MSLEDDSPVAHEEPCEEKTLDCERAAFLGCIQELELHEEASATLPHRTLGNVAVDLEHGDLEMQSPDSGAASRSSGMPSEQAEDCVPHAEPQALGECPLEACDSSSESDKKQQELQLMPGECVEAPASVDGRSASQAYVHHDIGLDDGHTELGELDDFDGNSAEEIGNPGPQREDRESATPSTDALEEETRTRVLAAAAAVASVMEDEQVPGDSAASSELATDDPSSSDLDFGIAAPTLPASVPSDCEVTDATQGMASSGESEMAFGIKQTAQELSEGIAESAAESDGLGSPSITNAADASIGPHQRDSEFSVILQDSLPAACDEAFEERGQDLELCQDQTSPVSDCTEDGNMAADLEHVDDAAAPKESRMDSEAAEAELCVPHDGHAEPQALGECPVEACDSSSESDKKQQELQLTPGECVEAPASVDGRSASETDVREMGLDDGCTQLGELDDFDGNSANEIGNPGPQREDRESATPSTDALEEKARTTVLMTEDAAVGLVLEGEQRCSKLSVADPGSSDLHVHIPLSTLLASVPSDCNVIDPESSTGQVQDASAPVGFHEAEGAADCATAGLDSQSFANDASAVSDQYLTVGSAGASNLPAAVSHAADSRRKQIEPALRHSASTSCLSLRKTPAARKDCRSSEAAAFRLLVSPSLSPTCRCQVPKPKKPSESRPVPASKQPEGASKVRPARPTAGRPGSVEISADSCPCLELCGEVPLLRSRPRSRQ